MAGTNAVDEKGRIRYIEPNNFNKYGMALKSDRSIPHPYEDYCISVDLTVSVPDVNSCGMPENNGGYELTFSSKKGTISFIDGNNGFLTTSYTDIDMLNPLRPDGKARNTECLGIESIDISYQNFYTPLINIKFVDIRGASLMSPQEQALYNTIAKESGSVDKLKKQDLSTLSGGSFFKALFSFPYPIFRLKVKGFYGKEVTYYLSMTSFNANFDANDGNFRVSADFVGYMYGVFVDLPMSYIAAAPYIKGFGSNYWLNNIDNGRFTYLDGYEGVNSNNKMLTFMQFKQSVSTVEEKAKKAIADTEDNKIYKEAKTILKAASGFGFYFNAKSATDLLSVWNYNGTNGTPYYYKIVLSTSEFESTQNNEYSSLTTANKKIQSFNTTYENAKINDIKEILESDSFDSKQNNKLSPVINFSTEEIKSGTGDSVVTKTKLSVSGGTTESVTFDTLIKQYPALGSLVDTDGVLKLSPGTSAKYAIFKLQTTVDHRQEIYDLIKKEEEILEERKKAIDETYRNSIIDSLGFLPSIQNMYEMTFAHIETFMACFYDCLKQIDNSKSDRKLKTLGVKTSDTDLSVNYSDDAPLPPFPLVTKTVVKEGKQTREIVLPDEAYPILANMPELKLVDELLKASRLLSFSKTDEVPETEVNQNKISSVGIIPTTLYDIANSKDKFNPYDVVVENMSSDFIGDQLAEFLLWIFFIRLYYYYLTSVNIIDDLRTFGYCEAYNFIKALEKADYVDAARKALKEKVIKKLTINGTNGLKGRVDNCAVADLIDSICASDHIKYPWNSTGNMTLRKVGSNVAVEYYRDDSYLPIGTFDWNEWSSDYGYIDNSSFKKKYVNCKSADGGEFKRYVYPSDLLSIFNNVDTIEASSYDRDRSTVKGPSSLHYELYTSGDNDTPVYSDDVMAYTYSSAATETDMQLSSIDRMRFRQISEASGISYNDLVDAEYERRIRSGRTQRVSISMMKQCNNGVNESQFKKLFIDPSKILSVNYMNTFVSMDTTTSDERIGFSNKLLNDVYNEQNNNYSKAYLLLYAIKNNSNSFIRSGGRGNGMFLNIELLKEGAHYWRQESMDNNHGEDPILSDKIAHPNRDQLYTETTPDERGYDGLALHEIGYNYSYYDYTSLETETVPKTRKEALINFFTSWVSNGSVYLPSFFELERALYQEASRSITVDEQIAESIPEVHMDVTKLSYIYQSKIMTMLYTISGIVDTSDIKIDSSMDKMLLIDAFNYFVTCLAGVYEKEQDRAESVEALQESIDTETVFKDEDLRLTTYLSLKNIYDRWICNLSFDNWRLRETGSRFSQFLYIDDYYRSIGQKLMVNASFIENLITTFCTTPNNDSTETKTNPVGLDVLSYLSKIAEKNGCVLYTIPMMLGFTDSESLIDMFDTKPYSSNVLNDTSAFVVLYNHIPSQRLNVENDDGSGNRDDGFDLADTIGNINPLLPDVFTDTNNDDYTIPAFGVSYAKGNQSYFKNISVDTSVHDGSQYSFMATLSIASKSAQGPRTSIAVGQDLYKTYSNYSYTCNVEMLGDMQITPLMYFQLNNIPMWKGAYRIVNVKHHIAPGDATTTFKGLRISKNATPIVKGKYLYINGEADWDTPENAAPMPEVVYRDAYGTTIDSGEYERRRRAAAAAWSMAFYNRSYDKKLISGYCARFTFYMARYYSKGIAFDAKQPCGHAAAYSQSYWKALEDMGYKKVPVADHISKAKIISLMADETKFAPGDVVVYYRGDSMENCYHTQIYIDASVKSTSMSLFDDKIKWASSDPHNHKDSSFCYKSRPYNDWMLIKFEAPSPGI